MAADPSAQMLAKGINFNGVLRVVQDTAGEEAREAVVADLEGPVGREIRYGGIVAGGWYPVAWYAALHEARERVLGAQLSAFEVGRQSVLRDFGGVYRALARLVRPGTFLKHAPRFWKMYWRGGTMVVAREAPGLCELSWSDCHGFDAHIWDDIAGGCAAIVEIAGHPEVECCLRSTDDHCSARQLEITWRP